MSAATSFSLREWFRTEVEDWLGLAPTSVSPQPVHVLNGLLYHALELPSQAAAATELLATRAGGWAVEPEQLSKPGALTLPTRPLDLQATRNSLHGVVAADRAVFRSAASFQVAHLGVVTSDPTHARLGSMAARLLLAEPAGRRAMEALAARLSQPHNNPVWLIEDALAGGCPGYALRTASPVPWTQGSPAARDLAGELAATLRRAARLAVVDPDPLLGLRSLALLASWSGLVAFAQAPRLHAGEPKLALICEAGPVGEWLTVRDAAAGSLAALHGSWERWLAERLAARARREIASGDDADVAALALLSETEVFGLSGGATEVKSQLPRIYSLWREDDAEPAQAAGQALADALLAGMGDKPRKWFGAVGRHCGFVGPRGGNISRLRVELSLLPSLVLAGLADDDGPTVAFLDWLDRLADRYGLVLGPHRLAVSAVPRPSEEELESNARALADALVALGAAHRYSDGVTEIINPLYEGSK